MNLLLTDRSIQLEPVREEHLPAMRAIYGSTRKEELSRVPHWSEEMKTAFIDQQFCAQHTYYLENYKGAEFLAIRKDNAIIGRLYLDRDFGGREIRIIDIALLPAWRNKGIGTGILEDLKREAENRQRPLSIHVESFNPAKKLYEKLGFRMVSETNGVYHLMEWRSLI